MVNKIKAAIIYYYNIKGGCDGNDNNFETLDKCHQTCSSNSAAAKDSGS